MRNKFVHSNTHLAERVQSIQPGFYFDPGRMPRNLFCRDDLTVEHWKQAARVLFEAGHNRADTEPSIFKRLFQNP